MDKIIYIYLAGTIKKGKEEDKELEWTKKEMDLLKQLLAPCTVHFLNPATRSDDLSDQKSVFGRDLFSVFSSHIVLVDAREKRGLGVGSEMMFAKMNRIPVVSWLPEESHYKRKELLLLGKMVRPWTHPFVYSLSDYLAPTLEQAASWIVDYITNGHQEIKGPEQIQETIHHYLNTQLKHDSGMHEMVSAHDYFAGKIKRLTSNSQTPK